LEQQFCTAAKKDYPCCLCKGDSNLIEEQFCTAVQKTIPAAFMIGIVIYQTSGFVQQRKILSLLPL
jgi:hypothetical protein